MKNIHFVQQEKYNDTTKYRQVSDFIYESLHDAEDGLVSNGDFVTCLSFTLEEELNELEERQYPLEDILNKYLAHVSDYFLDDEDSIEMILELCTADSLEKMQELVKIIGKRVYNKDVEENGNTYEELIIE